MSEVLHLAESIAREAHAGQLYGDRDYIEAHIAPVVGIIASLGYGEAYQATGWLHDTLEDNKAFTSEMLLQRGIPLSIVSSTKLLTKRGEPHETYMEGIATDEMATVAKFADSSVNLANTIMHADSMDQALFRRRVTTYTWNISYLSRMLPKV